MSRTEVSLDMKLNFIHGFSNKIRLQILEYLMTGEKTVTQIVETIQGNQSNISQHLACLKGCGLIMRKQEGKFVYYSIRSKKVIQLMEMFDVVLEEVEENVETCENHIV